MAIAYLTRRAVFSASHRLISEDLSESENKAIFGKCFHSTGHGHNYVLEVTIRGEINPKTGLIMNLVDLKQVIEAEIIQHVDHKHLNYDVEFLKGVNPTAENLVVVFWNRLKPVLKNLLFEIRLRETENNQSIYRGD